MNTGGVAGGRSAGQVEPLGQGDPCLDSWRHRLSFKLVAGLLLFFFLFTVSAYLAMQVRGRSVLGRQSDELTGELGRKLVLQLQQHLEASEVLAQTLATLGETLPKDVDVFKAVLPPTINLEDCRELIAGGGVWPEPGAFSPGLARRSFFWGRNSAGVLEYFEDYNLPEGPGYHNEEWYEPARHLVPGRVYWSKSYMDPYSFEPMVTCTAPMYRAGVFSGVATVDLKLNGIGAIMQKLAEESGGYAFVLDRNNKFICFPNPQIASQTVTDPQGKTLQVQRDIASVAREHPSFVSIAEAIQQLDKESARDSSHADSVQYANLIRQLRGKILVLEPGEAERVASGLAAPARRSLEPVKLEFDRDPVRQEAVHMLIYEMPGTRWRVVLAMPQSKAAAVVDAVVRRVAIFLLSVSLLICVFAWWYFRRALLRPLAHLTKHLRKLAEVSDVDTRLPVSGRDELARLAYWFNMRTSLLSQAYNELKEKNQLLDQARRAAVSADASKNIFLASMSHELRTPLNAIIGMSAFINGTKLDPEQTEYARTIHSSSNALLDLVNDIMDFSKIEAGQLELESHDFDMRDVLDEVTDILTYQATEKGLNFFCALDPKSDSMVRGDAGRVRQIIANLGANAVKFTRDGSVTMYGKIVRDEATKRPVMEFSVTDTGIGIPPEARERLFKPYSQAVGSTTRQHGGTGLGLVICKRLCELMGGDVGFESKVGEGTVFRFTVRLDEPVRKELSLLRPKAKNEARWRCLVVDTDPFYADFLCRQLAAWDIEALQAGSPELAAAHIVEMGGQSIVVILGVDRISDPHFGLKLRDLSSAGKLRIVLHRRSTLRESCSELERSGYDVFLAKPLRIAQLVNVVDVVFGAALAPAQSQAVPAPSDAATRPQQVLVVEDNILNQKVVAKMLKNIGHQFDVVDNGVKAVEAVGRKHYDLILMDWHMPEMDGLEATQRIRGMGGRYAVMPIVALTASALQNERQQCFEAGMNDYLSKPVTEKNLRSIFQKWLGCASAV